MSEDKRLSTQSELAQNSCGIWLGVWVLEDPRGFKKVLEVSTRFWKTPVVGAMSGYFSQPLPPGWLGSWSPTRAAASAIVRSPLPR